jgi:hypothetical protein
MPATFSAAFWSVRGVAKLLGIDAAKVLNWVHRGELTGVNVADRPGRRPRWRIADPELQRFLRARQSAAAPIMARPRRDRDERQYFRHGKPLED